MKYLNQIIFITGILSVILYDMENNTSLHSGILFFDVFCTIILFGFFFLVLEIISEK